MPDGGGAHVEAADILGRRSEPHLAQVAIFKQHLSRNLLCVAQTAKKKKCTVRQAYAKFSVY